MGACSSTPMSRAMVVEGVTDHPTNMQLPSHSINKPSRSQTLRTPPSLSSFNSESNARRKDLSENDLDGHTGKRCVSATVAPGKRRPAIRRPSIISGPGALDINSNSKHHTPGFGTVGSEYSGESRSSFLIVDIKEDMVQEEFLSFQAPRPVNSINTEEGRVPVQTTAREMFFGSFEQRHPSFKLYYSRPVAFCYEQSPFFQTISPGATAGMNDSAKMKEYRITIQDVQLPQGEHLNQWLGKHAIHFYNAISVFFHRISRLCTAETCPIMNAGSQFEYKWKDSRDRIASVTAPKYMQLLFEWINGEISDPKKFPMPCYTENIVEGVKSSTQFTNHPQFPDNFRTIVSNILRRLWRVIAHLYYSHFKRIRAIGLEAELNARFSHLAFVVLEFNLLTPAELRPLRSLILMRLPENLTKCIEW
uniref:Mob1/phocein family protein n=1 Tax=Spongospora subterranea TaxID=70186 RepID=A0A0H5R718_9EUKA|eukprot:CRZ09547.1 hypothetical protein [Spongospora subterranea]